MVFPRLATSQGHEIWDKASLKYRAQGRAHGLQSETNLRNQSPVDVDITREVLSQGCDLHAPDIPNLFVGLSPTETHLS